MAQIPTNFFGRAPMFPFRGGAPSTMQPFSRPPQQSFFGNRFGGAPSTAVGLPPQASPNAAPPPFTQSIMPVSASEPTLSSDVMNYNFTPLLGGNPSLLAPSAGLTQQQVSAFSPQLPQGYVTPPELIGAPMPTGMMQPQVMPPAPGSQLGQPPAMGTGTPAMPFGAVGQPPNFSNFTLPAANANAQTNSNAMSALQQVPAMNSGVAGIQQSTVPQQQGAMPQPALAPTAMARGGLNRIKSAMSRR